MRIVKARRFFARWAAWAIIALPLNVIETSKLNIFTNVALGADKNILADEEMNILEQSVFLSQDFELDLIEQKISRLIQISPDSSQVHFLMSSLLLRMYLKDPTDSSLMNQSASLAAQAYELDPKSDYGIVALANILDVNGETDKGLALLSEAERKAKIKISWRFLFTKTKLMAGLESASSQIASYESVLKDQNAIRSMIAPYVLSALLTEPADLNALSKIQRLNSNFPCSEFSLALANLQFSAGNINASANTLRSLVGSNSKSTEAFVRLASLEYFHLNDRLSAKKTLNTLKALSIPVHLAQEVATLDALLSIDDHSLKISKEKFLIALKNSKDQENTVTLISKSLIDKKRYSNTIEFLELAQTEAPGIATSYGLLGELELTQLHNNSRAKKFFSDAIVLRDDNSRYYSGRGLANYNMKDFKSALNDFENAARIDPNDGSVRYNIACILALTSRKAEALEALKMAIGINGNLAKNALTDSDLISLRGNEEFAQIVTSQDGPLLAH